MQTNESCWIELLVLNSNTWNSLTVCLNWIISLIYQYLKPFDCVQINEKYWIEWLVLNSNTCNHLTVCKQIELNY